VFTAIFFQPGKKARLSSKESIFLKTLIKMSCTASRASSYIAEVFETPTKQIFFMPGQ
jgi:hypothetical protein